MNNMKDLIALFDNHKIYDTDIWTNVLILLVFTDLYLGVCCPQKEPGITFHKINSNKPDSIRNIRYCLYLDCEIFYLYPLCIMYTSSTLNWELYFSI